MTLKDLIENKDYDYVSYRMILPDGQDIFAGCFKSDGGKIISIDGDSYSEDETIIRYAEWSSDKHLNGLTVWVEGEFL